MLVQLLLFDNVDEWSFANFVEIMSFSLTWRVLFGEPQFIFYSLIRKLVFSCLLLHYFKFKLCFEINWLVIQNLTLYFLYLCCFTLHCSIFYWASVSRITWCVQPGCVYVKHIKCWQGGREEAVLYGLWWVTGSGRGSYINSQINTTIKQLNVFVSLVDITGLIFFLGIPDRHWIY